MEISSLRHSPMSTNSYQSLSGCRFCACTTPGASAAGEENWVLGQCVQCGHHHNDHRCWMELGRRNLNVNPRDCVLWTPNDLRVKANFRAYLAAASYPGDGTVTMQLPDGSNRVVKEPNGLFACMVSGELGDDDQVRVLNLMPLHCTDDQIKAAGISRSRLSSTGNCVLVADQIVRAYQRLDISFVRSPNDHFALKIWTPVGLHSCHEYRGDARSIPLWDNTSGQASNKLLGEFEGKPLFVGANELFKQALAYQELFAFRQARERRWIRSDEAPSQRTMFALMNTLQLQSGGYPTRQY